MGACSHASGFPVGEYHLGFFALRDFQTDGHPALFVLFHGNPDPASVRSNQRGFGVLQLAQLRATRKVSKAGDVGSMPTTFWLIIVSGPPLQAWLIVPPPKPSAPMPHPSNRVV